MPSTKSLASLPVAANYPSENLTISAGVAIFHLRTSRVVVCYHTREKYWFLPKGRKNVNEDLGRAAEREGFEETGYRNRLLPLPMKTRQTRPDEGAEDYVTEAVWVQLLPLSARSQYLLFWFVAETLSPDDERVAAETEQTTRANQSANSSESAEQSAPPRVYTLPKPFPRDQTLQQRIAEDVVAQADGSVVDYMPVHHEGTGVCEDELCYKSYLLSVEEACTKLRGTVMEDVVRRGWASIQLRMEMEAGR